MTHIDDNQLELYALGRASSFEIVAIEEHLLICPLCNERLQSLEEFAKAMREAALEMTTELVETHRTADGLVYLYVRQSGPETWVSTIRGDVIGGGVSAAAREDAVAAGRACFLEMFPEHQCGPGCGTKLIGESRQ